MQISKRIFLKMFLVISLAPIWAKAAEHRGESAHVHGSVKMNIAFDGLIGKVEIEGPGESFVGFEHRATSLADQKTEKQALELLDHEIANMLVFDSALQCTWKKEKIELNYEHAGHSDLEATWSLKCKKAIGGSKIIFNIQQFFPRVHDLDLQVLADSIQVSGEIKKTGAEIFVK